MENFDQHISHQFNRELETLRHKMMTMGGLVEEMLKKALQAVSTGDTALAMEVMESDDRVNQIEKQLDEECTLIIARRQPTASDLRLVFSIIKTISDLERIGDEAEKIARWALSLADYPRPGNDYRELERLGLIVLEMLRSALDGFTRLSPEVALELMKSDKKVDQDYESIFRQYYSYMMEDARNIRRVLDALLVAKSLERIGDHCKNVGEYIVYLVQGQDLRHESKKAFKKAIKDGAR
ncbi:MAG: phosphate signaling complex protein PhoU [Wenzhouxiangellaceae bacterium]|nr:phosphate signaling complex protein PhoU [Wenzhouxiangellaceae bacterium]